MSASSRYRSPAGASAAAGASGPAGEPDRSARSTRSPPCPTSPRRADSPSALRDGRGGRSGRRAGENPEAPVPPGRSAEYARGRASCPGEGAARSASARNRSTPRAGGGRLPGDRPGGAQGHVRCHAPAGRLPVRQRDEPTGATSRPTHLDEGIGRSDSASAPKVKAQARGWKCPLARPRRPGTASGSSPWTGPASAGLTSRATG
jgi:hypothetical protein